MAEYFSVQSTADVARLRAGGQPWPTGLQRANIGIGLYAWESRVEADWYRQVLLGHGAQDLEIVQYEMADDELGQLATLDLTNVSDDDVDRWMEEHSHYGKATPHAYEHVIRRTDKGVEHYFAASVFGKLKEAP